jgi:hypothetical protein
VHSPHLRVTRRCLAEDLRLDADKYLSRDARAYCAEVEMLRTFVGKREGAPDFGEVIKGVSPAGKVKSLHIGRGRAATIWDPEHDVVWLLAYSETHATHEKRDVYQYFMSLDARDELLPTDADYEELDVLAEAFLLDGLVEDAKGIYLDARADPGVEFNASYGVHEALVVIDLVVEHDGEMEEGWISIGFPRDTPLTPESALDVIARILPGHINVGSLEFASKFWKRDLRPGELVFTWTYVRAI